MALGVGVRDAHRGLAPSRESNGITEAVNNLATGRAIPRRRHLKEKLPL